jgi:predicted enzyme related to lactoylglutathione lyase
MFKEANVTLLVKNFAGSFDFYSRVLGLNPTYHLHGEYAELTTSGLTGALKAGKSTASPAAGVSLGFTVEKLESSMERLAAKGVEFQSPGIVREGSTRLAFFSDLEGNALYLCELVQPVPDF